MSVLEIERISVVAPLGVRFRDRVTGAIVSSGLEAFVWPEAEPERVVRGVENRSGAFAFFGLPGLRDLEQGSGDSDYWAAQTPRFPFVLHVQDRFGRFLPLRLAVQLPLRRFLGLSSTDPADVPPVQTSGERESIPLASAPSRRPLEAMAVLHAALFDADHDEPAAWAVVEATAGDQTAAAGVADGDGTVMLPMPWPTPVLATSSGPPPPPVTQQTWPVRVSVRYRRRVPRSDIPDLADILSQPRVRAWADAARATELTTVTLSRGRELVLRTAAEPRSRLLITA